MFVSLYRGEPYADRMGAQGDVSAVRQLIAADAFVKRVTIRRP